MAAIVAVIRFKEGIASILLIARPHARKQSLALRLLRQGLLAFVVRP
jgi:hypothetical protein